MDIQLYSVEQAPKHVPVWHALMDDLCQPPAHRVARVLGVSVRTIRRYNATGEAPRVACLALYWLTSWGRYNVNAQAVNDAQVAVGYVNALRAEVNALRDQLEHLIRIGHFGAANDPAHPDHITRPRSPRLR
jgi:hypothetical protein